MTFNLAISNKHTPIGKTKTGLNVCLYNLQTGIFFTAEEDPEREESIAIHVSQATVSKDGIWTNTVNISREEGIDIFVEYFKSKLFPQFQREMPDLPMSDAFGYTVVRLLPQYNTEWCGNAWFPIASSLINKGVFT